MISKPLRPALDAWAADDPDISAIGLVGSYARGAEGPGSDVDLVVIARDPSHLLADAAWATRVCIWALPDCDDLLGLGLASRLLTCVRLCGAARHARRRKPRWVSARLVLHAPEASALAVPVHTSGSRGDGP